METRKRIREKKEQSDREYYELPKDFTGRVESHYQDGQLKKSYKYERMKDE